MLLAVLATVCWGVGDLLLTLAARHGAPAVAAVVVSGTGLLVAMVGVGIAPASSVAIGWCLLAGTAQGAGWLAWSAGARSGPVTVVAPIAGLVPPCFLFGLGAVRGSATTPGIVGATLAVVAVVCLTMRAGDAEGSAGRRTPAVLALLAGACFAVQLGALTEVGAGSALVILLSRAASVGVAGVPLLRQRPATPPCRAWAYAVVAGVAVAVGDLAILGAYRAAPLATVGAMTALTPGVTAALGVVVLGERARRLQAVGIVAALAAGLILAIA